MSKFRTIPFEFHILIGLPGSGKTYWATHNYPTNYFLNHTGRMIVDLDKFKDCGDMMLMKALDEEFKNYMTYYMTTCSANKVDVCIDGLVTTHDDLYNLIYGILMYMKRKCTWKTVNMVILLCLSLSINGMRIEKLASITIMFVIEM